MPNGRAAARPHETTVQLIFDRGDARRPKGHALIYFKSTAGEAVLATYLVVPPIAIDFSKYLPPMFAGQALTGNLAEFSAVVPLPPVPEAVPSLRVLRNLAEQRDDDLVQAGEADPAQLERLLLYTNEAAQLYQHMYADFARQFPAGEVEALAAEEEPGGPSAEELTYALMGERERLGELARLAGSLRYALDGNDRHLADETLKKMDLVAKHLPPKYWPDRVVAAANTPGERGGRLLQLYIDRCYKLLDEDYAAVAGIERKIEES